MTSFASAGGKFSSAAGGFSSAWWSVSGHAEEGFLFGRASADAVAPPLLTESVISRISFCMDKFLYAISPPPMSGRIIISFPFLQGCSRKFLPKKSKNK